MLKRDVRRLAGLLRWVWTGCKDESTTGRLASVKKAQEEQQLLGAEMANPIPWDERTRQGMFPADDAPGRPSTEYERAEAVGSHSRGEFRS